MAKKYKAKSKRTIPGPTKAEQNKYMIGKGKILLILVLLTALVAGVYIAAMQNEFEPVFHIYWVISAVLMCVFLFLKYRNEYLYTKALDTAEKTQSEITDEYRKRIKHIKYLLCILMPFVFTLIGDTVYLVFLVDSGIPEAVAKLFGLA